MLSFPTAYQVSSVHDGEKSSPGSFSRTLAASHWLDWNSSSLKLIIKVPLHFHPWWKGKKFRLMVNLQLNFFSSLWIFRKSCSIKLSSDFENKRLKTTERRTLNSNYSVFLVVGSLEDRVRVWLKVISEFCVSSFLFFQSRNCGHNVFAKESVSQSLVSSADLQTSCIRNHGLSTGVPNGPAN